MSNLFPHCCFERSHALTPLGNQSCQCTQSLLLSPLTVSLLLGSGPTCLFSPANRPLPRPCRRIALLMRMAAPLEPTQLDSPPPPSSFSPQCFAARAAGAFAPAVSSRPPSCVPCNAAYLQKAYAETLLLFYAESTIVLKMFFRF